MPFFGSFFYGTDYYGFPTIGTPGGPTSLVAYQNVDGNVVLYWRMEPCTSSLNSFTWTVDTDVVSTFDSSKFRTYSSVANPDYISGGIHKGLVVPTYPRLQGISSRMFWRVKGTHSGIDTDTVTSFFDEPEAIDQVTRQAMLDTLPDVIYKKDFAAGTFHAQAIVFDGDLVAGNTYNLSINGVPITPVTFSVDSATTMAAIATAIASNPDIMSAKFSDVGLFDKEIVVTAAQKDERISLFGSIVTGGTIQASTAISQRNSSNINRIYNAFGQEMDKANFELILTENDIFTYSVRDISIAKNFCALLDIQQPAGMETIDFREIIAALMREAGNTPTVGALKRVIDAIFCEDPSITLIRDTQDIFVDDPSSMPAVEPAYVDDSSSSPPVLPGTIWDNQNLASGVIININNPLALSIPADFVEKIVSKIVPAHCPVYITGI